MITSLCTVVSSFFFLRNIDQKKWRDNFIISAWNVSLITMICLCSGKPEQMKWTVPSLFSRLRIIVLLIIVPEHPHAQERKRQRSGASEITII